MLGILIFIVLIVAVIILFGQVKKINKRLDSVDPKPKGSTNGK